MTDHNEAAPVDRSTLTKVVFQTDHHGYLVSSVVLDASDLSPEDEGVVWLIPGGCVEEEPPEAPPEKLAKWAGGAWVLVTDLRGRAYWDQVDHTKHVIDAPEVEPPEGALMVDPGPSDAAKLLTLQRAARAALSASDISVLRCIERGIEVPAEWVIYRDSLRGIVGAAEWIDDLALPTRPDYPTGT